MKYGILGVILLGFIACLPQKSNDQEFRNFAVDKIKNFQNEMIKEWTDPQLTPLKEDEKENFKGITFFPIDLDYRVKAKFSFIKKGKTHPFPTSANKIKYYKEYGKLNFKIKNKKFELTLYQSDPPVEGYETSLFLPFMDETNGDTSYGGGRYLDFELSDIQSNSILIDFNQAYNPYCAYSSYYNCPIPPKNNYLDIEINAGVSYNP